MFCYPPAFNHTDILSRYYLLSVTRMISSLHIIQYYFIFLGWFYPQVLALYGFIILLPHPHLEILMNYMYILALWYV